MRTATMLLAVVVVLVAAPACTNSKTGVDAYEKGDYATALKEFRPLAERGDARAQFRLGVMYTMGQGVPQDDKEAARWYRLAATQGYAAAQYNLGVMYFMGIGVPRDVVRAHLWYSLAAAPGHENARRARDIVAKKMTPAQITEAQRLARKWTPGE